MTDEPQTPTRKIDGRAEFQAAVRSALAEAAEHGCPTLWLCDADFADWPLGERRAVESLTAWVGARRRLTVIAHHFDGVVRQHPRFVDWRRQWAHLIDCRSPLELEASQVPTVLLAPGRLSLHLVDPLHHRGSASREPAAEIARRELIDAVLQRSVEAFPASTTGL